MIGKKLLQLLHVLSDFEAIGSTDQIIQSVAYDSRKVTAGTLFICLPGSRVDGHEYIVQAHAAGAVAVLVERNIANVPAGLTVIRVPSTRDAMYAIAPYFFDYPARKLRLIGITGTNGKTTTAYLISSIFKQAGFKVGIIGTIQTMIEDQVLPMSNTTPDVVELQSLLAQMVVAGIEYVVMEVSSHALALNRIAGCEFDVGVFTNITRDHLDFHHTFENYTQAKATLFAMLGMAGSTKTGKAAVINCDDGASAVMLANTICKTLTYGIEQQADIVACDIDVQASGAAFRVVWQNNVLDLDLHITGVFNVYNVLAAIGVAVAEGVDANVIKAALQAFTSVAGRFELIRQGQDFTVIVDYAHTPDGLENILTTAKQLAKQRIIIVFGCGGDRDRTKRPLMGRIAARLADVVIATSDNPRSEDPAAILAEIEIGIQETLTHNKQYKKVIDRRQAIAEALSMAASQDIVIVAGKGHENYQILKNQTIPFDDKEVVRQILGEMV